MLLKPASREAQKHSHLHLYTLFGDPAMRLAYPETAALTLPTGATAPGATLEVKATLGALGPTGNALVTLETARTRIAGALAPVPAEGDPTRDGVIEANYATANNKVVAKVSVTVKGGALTAALPVPAGLAAGDYHVKVYADDGAHDVAAAGLVKIGP